LIIHAIHALAGSVIIQAIRIDFKRLLCTYILSFPFALLSHSLMSPIQKTHPMAICVELTGIPKVLAIITVSAVDKATE